MNTTIILVVIIAVLLIALVILILRNNILVKQQQKDITTNQCSIIESENMQSVCDELRINLGIVQQSLSDDREVVTCLKMNIATLEAEVKAKDNLLNERDSQEKRNEERLKLTFEKIANDILEKKSDNFTKSGSVQLKHILEPIEKDLNSFKLQIEKNFLEDTKTKSALSTELKQLLQLNQQLSTEANNLTKALKGEVNNKFQGDWGEMILETILTNSGLEKGVHYFTQVSERDEDGRNKRPDVIVRYPDGSEVIIDSKVSLTAYSHYSSCEDETERKKSLNEHISSVKRHIMQLSEKRYEAREKSFDFVMMFLPIEPAYMAALGADNTLWQYAYSHKILLVSPTHLITALKLVHDLWTRYSQTKNTIAIAEQGAKMYDKFVLFVKELEKVGINLERSSKSYQDAMSKLQNGNGNLIGQAEKLMSLGIKTKKQLSIKENTDVESNSEQVESHL